MHPRTCDDFQRRFPPEHVEQHVWYLLARLSFQRAHEEALEDFFTYLTEGSAAGSSATGGSGATQSSGVAREAAPSAEHDIISILRSLPFGRDQGV